MVRSQKKPGGGARGLRDLREHNRRVVLGLLKDADLASRSSLSRASGLSLPTLMELVADLIEERVIEEVGSGPSNGGRPPRLLRLRPKAMATVGISLGTQTITGVVTDLRATVQAVRHQPSRIRDGRDALRAQVESLLATLLEESRSFSRRVLGVGLAVPAALLASQGRTFAIPNGDREERVRPQELIPASLRDSVVVDNYANALAVGEHLYGSGQGAQHLLCVVLQHAPGSALIVNGQLHRGRDGAAGEIADMLIDPAGPMCTCGRRGCLSAFVGHRAIVGRARDLAALVGARSIGGIRTEDLSAPRIIELSIQGDEIAGEVMREVGRYLGVGVANLTALIDPNVVVLGGPTMRAPQILPAAEQVMRERFANPPPLRLCSLGEDAAAVGAAALVLLQLFSPPSGIESREPAP